MYWKQQFFHRKLSTKKEHIPQNATGVDKSLEAGQGVITPSNTKGTLFLLNQHEQKIWM